LDADHPALIELMAKPEACGYWHDTGHAWIKQNMDMPNHREHLEKNAANAIGSGKEEVLSSKECVEELAAARFPVSKQPS
jgi:hypothetical protein